MRYRQVIEGAYFLLACPVYQEVLKNFPLHLGRLVFRHTKRFLAKIKLIRLHAWPKLQWKST